MGVLELGNFIRDRRKNLGITQPHLAELAGVSKNTLYKLENGQSNPSWEVVEKLIDVLGLELSIAIKTMISSENKIV